VSRDGIDLVLVDTTPNAVCGNRVIVAVDVPRASLRLRGDVRRLDAVEDGGVRVELEFAALSAFERDMFDSFLTSTAA
jgi:hypothetical protein